MPTPPTIVVAEDKDHNPLYSLHFATEQEAHAYLHQIECKTFPSTVAHTAGLEKPYHTSITFEDIRLCRQFFRLYSQSKKPKGKFVLKAIRADEKGFFKDFMKTITIGEKKPLRAAPKNLFTVTAKGVFKRNPPNPDREEELGAETIPLKIPQYSKAEKKGFSKAQAASLGDATYHPAVFGFNAPQCNNLLSGIILDCKDVLFTDRNYVSDCGTVRRPYDFHKRKDAEHYYSQQVTLLSAGKQLYAADEIDSFLTALKKQSKKAGYNEILVRMRCPSLESIQFFIAADTLACRLQTKEYARLFHAFLVQNNLAKLSDIPTCVYYLPEAKSRNLHFSVYTYEEQLLDELEARLSWATPKFPTITDLRQILTMPNYDEFLYMYYRNKSFHSLLALTPDEIKNELKVHYNGSPVFWQILKSGVQLMESLADLADFDLANAINDPLYETKNFQNEALFHLTRVGYSGAVAKHIQTFTGPIELKAVMPIDPTQDISGNLSTLAVHNNNLDVIQALIAKNDFFPHKSALFFIAAKKGLLDMFKLVNATDEYQNTFYPPLIAAAENDHLDIICFLVESKLALSHLGLALLRASEAGHRRIVKYLIEKGADINFEGLHNNETKTPLYVAADEGHYQIVKDLLEAGANPNGAKNNSWKLIIRAARNGYIKIIKLLVEYGSNINERDHNGYSALHWSVTYNDTRTMIYLIDQGAKVLDTDHNIAVERKYTQIQKILAKVLANDKRLHGIKTKLQQAQIIESKTLNESNAIQAPEVESCRRAAFLTLRKSLINTQRYNNDMVEKLEEHSDDFIRFDKTCEAFIVSADHYTATNPKAAHDFKHEIAVAYQQYTESAPNSKRILSALIQKAETFNDTIKAELKTKKPQEKVITYISFLSLWKREEVLAREIQANVCRFTQAPNPNITMSEMKC